MRGTVAKRIRRQVYGDQSPGQRQYRGGWVRRAVKGARKLVWTGPVQAQGLRRRYQEAKRAYKRGRHGRPTA